MTEDLENELFASMTFKYSILKQNIIACFELLHYYFVKLFTHNALLISGMVYYKKGKPVHNNWGDDLNVFLIELLTNKRVFVCPVGHIPDRLDVSNLQEMTLSIPYNPLIAKSFYYRQMFENWGRGIRLMVDECKDAGLQTPVFISSEYQVTAIFQRNDYSEDKSKLSKNQSVKDTVKDTVKDIILNVNDRQMSIIEIMKEQPSVSAEDLALKVGINIRNVKRNLAKLKQDGIIERVGSDKNGYWKVNI